MTGCCVVPSHWVTATCVLHSVMYGSGASAQEIGVPGSMPSVIRVMIHAYADDRHDPVHVYLGETAALRQDLHGAQ